MLTLATIVLAVRAALAALPATLIVLVAALVALVALGLDVQRRAYALKVVGQLVELARVLVAGSR